MEHFRHFLRCFLYLCFISSFLGCSVKEELNPTKGINNTDIKGVWVNTLVTWDTIRVYDTIITRWDELSSSYGHYYKYKINYDSIILDYSGTYKVGVPPCTRKILLNDKQDSLIIQNFHTVFPGYEGDKFFKPEK